MLQDLHNFIRQLMRKNRTSFVTTQEITNAINASSRDLWKELIKKYQETGIPSDLLVPFKGSVQDTLSSGEATLSGLGTAYLAGVSIVLNSREYPTILLHSDKDWSMRRTIKREDDTFLLKREEYASGDISNGTGSLPVDYQQHRGVIYYSDNGTLYEGQILDHDEFYNRKNSKIIPPTIQNPIATIYQNTIEFAPQALDNATDDDYILVYNAYTDIRNAFSRYEKSSSDMIVEVDGGASETINSYYYTFPATASHDAPTYTKQVANALANPVETGWDYDAFGEIATRAITYLGLPIQSDQALQLEQIKNANDIQSLN